MRDRERKREREGFREREWLFMKREKVNVLLYI